MRNGTTRFGRALRWMWTAAIALVLAFAGAAPAMAQGPDAILPGAAGLAGDSAQTDRQSRSEILYGVSPGGAFFRGVVLPGWGHASINSYSRGAFYFAAESGVAWMLFRTLNRLDSAKDAKRVREAQAAARLQADGIFDPIELADGIAADEKVREAQALIDSRSEQREDWVALAIFVAFFSGADAFVSAHLVDFPEPLSFRGVPGGEMEISFSIPLRIPGG